MPPRPRPFLRGFGPRCGAPDSGVPDAVPKSLFTAFVLLGCALLWASPGAGYVVPPQKELQRWVATRGAARSPVTLSVRWGVRSGTLYASGPGASALNLDGEPPRTDPGPASTHSLAPLWLALDLFTEPTSEGLAEILTEAGLDLGRSGYARSPLSRDGVGITVGARGEGEAGLPQVHFARRPLWPVLVRVDGRSAQVGPARADGWPRWIAFGDGSRLEIIGPAVPAPSPPAWALGVPEPESTAPAIPEWRGAFEGARP